MKIRVRIWDGKKYHYPDATKDESNHYLQFGSDGFWLFNQDGKLITSTEQGGVCELSTMLKDKNGKEIYEGDLLKLPHNDYIAEGLHEVHYYNDGFVTSNVLFSDKEKANKNSLTWIINRGGCVIGNTHENPELLKTEP